MTSHEKFNHNLTLKSKFSGKFQRFNAIDGSIEMMKNSWISEKRFLAVQQEYIFYNVE